MRILLIGPVPPCSNYTAGILLDQLCSSLPRGSFVCFSVVARGVAPAVTATMDGVPMRTVERPREHWHLFPKILGDAFSALMESVTSLTAARRIRAQAVSFGREFGVDRVWCVLEGQTLIRIALPVARALRVPLCTQVLDPPGWWLRDNRVDRVSAGAVLRRFERTLRKSTATAVVSWAMAEEYARRYGAHAVPVVPGLPASLAQPHKEEPRSGEEYTVGLAGQAYASQEWDALMAALRSACWQIAGRRVKVVVLGRQANLSADSPTQIEYLGWRPQAETVSILSQLDLLYCPYWFDPAFETEARLAFPSKLAPYLASGSPVLFHGPEYAAPARFLKENGAAFFCHTLEPAEILRQLHIALTDTAARKRVASSGRRAFDSHLTAARMETGFRQFIGLEDLAD